MAGGDSWIEVVSSAIWVVSSSWTSMVVKISSAWVSVMTARISGLAARVSAWSGVTAVARIWVISATALVGGRSAMACMAVVNCFSVNGLLSLSALRRACTSSLGTSTILGIGSVTGACGTAGRVLDGGGGMVVGWTNGSV